MDLGEAVYREITGGRSPHTEIASLGDALQMLIGLHGSRAAAARSLGLPPSTVRGWTKGRTPKRDTSWIVTEARQEQRRSRLSRGRERRLRSGMDGATITGTYVYTGRRGGGTMSGTEGRDIPIGEYLDDIADDLVDAYLDGASTQELAEMFHGGINDRGFYEQTFDPHDPDGGWDIDSLDGWA